MNCSHRSCLSVVHIAQHSLHRTRHVCHLLWRLGQSNHSVKQQPIHAAGKYRKASLAKLFILPIFKFQFYTGIPPAAAPAPAGLCATKGAVPAPGCATMPTGCPLVMLAAEVVPGGTALFGATSAMVPAVGARRWRSRRGPRCWGCSVPQPPHPA